MVLIVDNKHFKLIAKHYQLGGLDYRCILEGTVDERGEIIGTARRSLFRGDKEYNISVSEMTEADIAKCRKAFFRWWTIRLATDG